MLLIFIYSLRITYYYYYKYKLSHQLYDINNGMLYYTIAHR